MATKFCMIEKWEWISRYLSKLGLTKKYTQLSTALEAFCHILESYVIFAILYNILLCTTLFGSKIWHFFLFCSSLFFSEKHSETPFPLYEYCFEWSHNHLMPLQLSNFETGDGDIRNGDEVMTVNLIQHWWNRFSPKAKRSNILFHRERLSKVTWLIKKNMAEISYLFGIQWQIVSLNLKFINIVFITFLTVCILPDQSATTPE